MNVALGLLSATVFALNTLFWCLCLYALLALRTLAPRARKERFSLLMVGVAERWIAGNSRGLEIFHRIAWEIEIPPTLRLDRSYLVCSNHRAWTDIVVLQKILNRRIPFPRFFIKSQLVYVPLLGPAWLALDFPRMRRFAPSVLAKHPEKRGQDLATTRKVCARFRGRPVSMLNFLEGTRFTEAKRAAQGSPYRYLLKPKLGGLSFVLGAMGEQFHALLDVTIDYPDGAVTLWGLLSGRLTRVRARVRELGIPRAFVEPGPGLSETQDRRALRDWVEDIWREKDAWLAGAE